MSRDSLSQSGRTFPSGLKDAITYTRFVITDHLYFIIQTYVRKINRENSDLGKIILGNIPKVAFVYFVGGVGIDIYIEANIFYRIWVGETSIGLEKWDNGTKTIVWSMPTV